ncbi:MAG: hypothetical protein L0Z50_15135 [Verrucomicrobiales bacterium]|nr:hypothetical protein [Verrucomicrobiales bacterium]
MLPLDDKLWSDLNHKGGGPLYPAVLRHLNATIAAGKYSRDCLVDLETMCHQWSTYELTLAAVPHLVDSCRKLPPESTARIELLAWVGWCVACIHLNRQDGSEQLKQWYNDSIPVARDLIAESLPFTRESDGEPSNVRALLAAFAACHGSPALAFILYELDAGGWKCDHCKSFILPMESSMNPFWVERSNGS